MSDPRDFINFDEIDKDGPQSYSRTISVSASELQRDEIAGVGPVAIKASVQKGSRPGEYLIEGSASFTADLTCARCLEPYPFASSSTFHLRFQPRPGVPQREDHEIEIAPDELDVEFYTGRQIPLRDLAFEQIQLSIPMKPLCREDCLGLCPACGTNRNREVCACEESAVDDRSGALREIRQVIKKRES
ncbi:MAG TPA: DUF177 domain-containing protein [Thermoanaerobaculia bacterium]|nr:DUF177 domain-containing protein [Thermoanaerobaculia bacterium]